MNIILSGSIAMDRIMVFKGHFKDVIQMDKLHVLSISLLLDRLEETHGGVAANIAYSLAQLGETPILLGSVGKNARDYIQELANFGVLTSAVHYSDLPTASFSVMTDLDNCQIGGFYPGAMGDAASLTLDKWSPSDSFVVISPHDPGQMARQVVQCAAQNYRLFYDVGQQVTNVPAEDIKAGVEAAELLIVNDYEMGVICQKTGWSQEEVFTKLKVCVITFGEKGSQVMTDGMTTAVPAVNRPQVVDPTGAGDAFRAGFIYGYVRDWPLTTCARLGSVVAWFSLGSTGTQAYRFTQAEAAEKYQETYQEPLIFN